MSRRDSYENFDDFFSNWEGSMRCSCDHGCNQELKQQETRMALAVRMLKSVSKNLDKLATLPLDRVNKMWLWISNRESSRENYRMNLVDMLSFNEKVMSFGAGLVANVLKESQDDYKLAAAKLGIKSHVLKLGFIEWNKLSEDSKEEARKNKVEYEAKR